MADSNAALAAAITALTNILTNMQNNPQPPPVTAVLPPPPVPVVDPYQETAPFDLSSRAGSTAYTLACLLLDKKWDGSITAFPLFLIALRVRATEVNWGAAAPHGILIYAVQGVDENLFTEHHFISETTLKAARVARTDARAIQNSRSLYKCLKGSIEGDIRAVLFSQDGNLPGTEDGPLLFKLLTSFTMASSLQLSMLSFQHILGFEAADHSFNVNVINAKLSHLFVLATTREHILSQHERSQHTLAAYARIKQPEAWAQFIRNQVDEFEAGNLNNCQAFMNSAALKYTKIAASTTGFQGSSTTIQVDIVAMLAAKQKKTVADVSNSATKIVKKTRTSPANKKLPSFIKHFKTSSAPEATAFKVGDSKEFNGEMWYFCDCPTHRDKIKWYTHTHTACHTRKKWIEEGDNSSLPAASIVDDSDNNSRTTSLTESTNRSSMSSVTDMPSLLAAALSMAGNNSAAKDAIADALNALADE